MNKKQLQIHFGENDWQPDYTKFKYSGWALFDKIPEDDSILDVGCGHNLFKPHRDNLWGIDPANKCADELVTLEEFDSKGKQYDSVLCLSSLNFGDRTAIEAQVAKVVSLTREHGIIYWRQNPGTGSSPWQNNPDVKFFPWTLDLNYELAEKFGCTVWFCDYDSGDRIYAEWRKNA